MAFSETLVRCCRTPPTGVILSTLSDDLPGGDFLSTHKAFAPMSPVVGRPRKSTTQILAVPLLASRPPFGKRRGPVDKQSYEPFLYDAGSSKDFMRTASLNEFGEPKSPCEVAKDVAVDPLFSMSVMELLVANVQAKVQMEDFEVFSGRMAMMIFFSAVLVESLTGDGVFSGIDGESLAAVAFIAVAGAAGTAFLAMGARSKEVAAILAAGCKNLVDSAVDNVIEGLFFDAGPAAFVPTKSNTSSTKS
eukprot:TRINITY_DN614_c0_g2_i1.p1 TRINITY_DN614_c0_g2~~TRINITY_DN614_c0_g2_i1.p1  ORF type:complete len:248 (-),score=56.21 TRINITY_DN614_c0_g2_i1:651-1394(-)